ncbi:MAG: HypC/HybG/HupF family hydrogenase formation chaperone, partial [Gemmatimonadetes bacterium]|nr:HypC/HybG/HupF family hydrogenase formation chaperone [Gemmatimonadota bacterium]
MCLAVPGPIVDLVDETNRLAEVSVAGVNRTVNIALLDGVDGGAHPRRLGARSRCGVRWTRRFARFTTCWVRQPRAAQHPGKHKIEEETNDPWPLGDLSRSPFPCRARPRGLRSVPVHAVHPAGPRQPVWQDIPAGAALRRSGHGTRTPPKAHRARSRAGWPRAACCRDGVWRGVDGDGDDVRRCVHRSHCRGAARWDVRLDAHVERPPVSANHGGRPRVGARAGGAMDGGGAGRAASGARAGMGRGSPAELSPPVDADPADAIRRRDEILQVMFWMRGEGLADDASPDTLLVFLGEVDDAMLRADLDALDSAGLLERMPGGSYRLTPG